VCDTLFVGKGNAGVTGSNADSKRLEAPRKALDVKRMGADGLADFLLKSV